MKIDYLRPVIELKEVSKRYRYWTDRPASIKSLLVDLVKGKLSFGLRNEATVLKGISFKIYPGEFVGIMGRNGAGKSSLLKIIAGIYSPTSGQIIVGEQIAPLIELGAGFHGDLSGYENIFLNASILGFGRQETLLALPKIIEFSELGEKIHMPVKNYSTGMLVRLGFSIATHLTAPIILVDEVLAVGDAGFQEKCLAKIHELHKEGRTIILVTHDVSSVRNHCNRCILIEAQGVVYDGEVLRGTDMYSNLVRH